MSQAQFTNTMPPFTPLVSSALLSPIKLLLLALLALLCLLSTRLGALLLATPLEQQNPALLQIPPTVQAIVVLGGGRRSNAPQYASQDGPSHLTLARLQYAARLQHASGLPILVSGGGPDGSVTSEAELMARSLRDDFHAHAQWQESQSATTTENAAYSVPILRQAGIQKILLVTDAIHMPRALASFRRADPSLSITAAPTAFLSTKQWSMSDFLPTREGLYRSNYALHEWLGMLWYKIRAQQ